MYRNVFNTEENKTAELWHSAFNSALADARNSQGSFKEFLYAAMEGNEELKHSIVNLDYLFPEAKIVGQDPYIYNIQPTLADEIIAGTRKSPFSKIKSLIMDLSEEECRALGYIKGDQKIEQIFKFMKRETSPQTIYKLQKIDRDDVVDITDYNIVNMIQSELKMKLKEEVARALLVGDGRAEMINGEANRHKIQEDKIRPIISDDDFYTIKLESERKNLIDTLILSRVDYRGSGTPSLYINPNDLAKIRIMKDKLGRYLYETDTQIAAKVGVSAVKETVFMPEGKMVIVNLTDYTMGSTKGGEITSFDDFDIDFNKLTYLVETRLCGALTVPKSAITITLLPDTPDEDIVIPDGE